MWVGGSWYSTITRTKQGQSTFVLFEQECEWGEMAGPCGRVCLRGPGQRCGGVENINGVCGPGLDCDGEGFR